jgi:hypothetical protein
MLCVGCATVFDEDTASACSMKVMGKSVHTCCVNCMVSYVFGY